MIPVLETFKEKYKLEQLVVVADSGLLSNQNVTELQQKNYEFILGARIKNESQSIKKKILALKLKNGESALLKKDGLKLIISYSDTRAKKENTIGKRGLEALKNESERENSPNLISAIGVTINISN